MKTMTVRDVRQRWPEAEQALATELEIIITRDGKPVARLLPMEGERPVRRRFDPVAQRRRRDAIFGQGVEFESLSGLLEDREERSPL